MTIWTGNRVRLERTRAELEKLTPRNRQQKVLKRTLESALAMAEIWSVPGKEERFERAWQIVELLRDAWDLPLGPTGPPHRLRLSS